MRRARTRMRAGPVSGSEKSRFVRACLAGGPEFVIPVRSTMFSPCNSKHPKRRALDCVYGRSPFYTVPSRPEVRELSLTSDRRPLENGMIRRPTTPGPMPPSATRLRLASLALVMGILIDCGNAGWPSSDAEYGIPGSDGELVTCGISLIVSS